MRVTLMSGTLSVSISKPLAGFSSNDGRGSNLLPARSDSPDLVDGGPDGGDIAPKGIFGKPEMVDLVPISSENWPLGAGL